VDVYRFLLSRHWLGLLALSIIVATACVGLGDWQLHRLAHRHERNDLIRSARTAPPQPVSQALQVGRDPAADRQFDPVRATGRWDVDHQLLVRLRPLEGQVGYYVITPLVTGDGRAVLVNRGWVPAADDGSRTPVVPRPPDAPVTITGRLRPSEPPARGAAPPPGQVTRIDVPGIARTLPYGVYGGFLELTSQQPRQGTSPRLIPPPEPSEGPHLLYAVQWFLFACLALAGYVVLARREAADRRTTPERPVTAVAAR
jgi:cytochrome oxidase assembly protein ShyY1